VVENEPSEPVPQSSARQPKMAARIGDEQTPPAPPPEATEPAPQPQATAKVEEKPAAPAPVAPPDQNVAAAPAEPAQEPAAAEDKADRQAPPAAGQVVIQPGNNLWRISRVIYGRGVQYTVIYEANRDHIRDPDLIYPGQIFATPGVRPPQEIDPRRRQPLAPEELEGESSQ
jgi:nucleoid-associated protein YgaU